MKHSKHLGHYVQAGMAVYIACIVSACTTADPTVSSKAYRGVISLDAVRFGFTEDTAKSANLTFVADPKVVAPFSQYLSRSYDNQGGQYMIDYYNHKPISLHVIYADKPISKEDALVKLKALLPQNAPPEGMVKEFQAWGKNKDPGESRVYGEDFKALLIFADKEATKVKMISVYAQYKPSNQQKGKGAATAPLSEENAGENPDKKD